MGPWQGRHGQTVLGVWSEDPHSGHRGWVNVTSGNRDGENERVHRGREKEKDRKGEKGDRERGRDRQREME